MSPFHLNTFNFCLIFGYGCQFFSSNAVFRNINHLHIYILAFYFLLVFSWFLSFSLCSLVVHLTLLLWFSALSIMRIYCLSFAVGFCDYSFSLYRNFPKNLIHFYFILSFYLIGSYHIYYLFFFLQPSVLVAFCLFHGCQIFGLSVENTKPFSHVSHSRLFLGSLG